jgi:hypothetical protein
MEASAFENAKESKMKMKRKLNPDVANRAVYRRKPPADVAAGVLAATTCLSASVCAHTTPADFAEMSLDQLFATTIGDETSGPQGGAGRWRFVYQFNQMEFQSYRDGTDDLSNDEVLWAGRHENRRQLSCSARQHQPAGPHLPGKPNDERCHRSLRCRSLHPAGD